MQETSYSHPQLVSHLRLYFTLLTQEQQIVLPACIRACVLWGVSNTYKYASFTTSSGFIFTSYLVISIPVFVSYSHKGLYQIIPWVGVGFLFRLTPTMTSYSPHTLFLLEITRATCTLLLKDTLSSSSSTCCSLPKACYDFT